MGRHSSPSKGYLYRSFTGWLLPWVVLAALLGVLVWAGVSTLTEGELSAPPPGSPKKSPAGEAPTPPPSSAPATSPTPEKRRAPEPRQPAALATEGVTVQVLNGTTVAEANDRIAERLEKLGYEVVSLAPARTGYSRTIVHWSYAAARDEAIALAERFGWTSAPSPGNLSTRVQVHVIVGEDET